MKIALARHAGFCFGVRRSVDAVNALLNQGCRPTTLGPVIHNPTVVEAMRARGAVVAESLEQIQGDTVVIRSHGEAEAVHEALRARGLTIVDTTCPFVARIHRRVKEASQAGLPVVIVGEAGHAEVEGILGWVQGTARCVVGSEEEARALPEMAAACIVAQTTTPKGRYDAICKILQGRIGRCRDLRQHLSDHRSSPERGAGPGLARGRDAGHRRSKQFQYAKALRAVRRYLPSHVFPRAGRGGRAPAPADAGYHRNHSRRFHAG